MDGETIEEKKDREGQIEQLQNLKSPDNSADMGDEITLIEIPYEMPKAVKSTRGRKKKKTIEKVISEGQKEGLKAVKDEVGNIRGQMKYLMTRHIHDSKFGEDSKEFKEYLEDGMNRYLFTDIRNEQKRTDQRIAAIEKNIENLLGIIGQNVAELKKDKEADPEEIIDNVAEVMETVKELDELKKTLVEDIKPAVEIYGQKVREMEQLKPVFNNPRRTGVRKYINEFRRYTSRRPEPTITQWGMPERPNPNAMKKEPLVDKLLVAMKGRRRY